MEHGKHAFDQRDKELSLPLKPEGDGWEENTGIRLVGVDAIIEVVLRDGSRSKDMALHYRWDIIGSFQDIVWWRMAWKAPKVGDWFALERSGGYQDLFQIREKNGVVFLQRKNGLRYWGMEVPCIDKVISYDVWKKLIGVLPADTEFVPVDVEYKVKPK